MISQLDILFGNLGEMVEFQVEFLRTLEDGIKLVPDLDRLERVEQFKVSAPLWLTLAAGFTELLIKSSYFFFNNEGWCRLCFPQKVLFSLGGSFLYYADRFKIYSAFCASHTKVPKVLAKGKAGESPAADSSDGSSSGR